MRKTIAIALIAVASIVSAIVVAKHFREPLYHSQGYVFGTLIDITIYGVQESRASELANHILKDFQGLHERMHAWKVGQSHQPSELGKVNAAFVKRQSIQVSDELATILTDAKRLSIQTQDLFNPAIGHLIAAWGFQRDEFAPINLDQQHLEKLVLAQPKMSDVVIENNIVSTKNSAVRLDLGGYVKGYALDKAARYLRQQGVNHALINIGGNIIAIGRHGNQPWRVGIQHPRQPSAIATLELDDGWAIGTSGDYQRYFMQNNQRYCHIIDPRDGVPVQHTQAVTVLIPPQMQTGVLSDVASKPIFIQPENKKSDAASQIGVDYYLVIDGQSRISATRKMLEKLHWTNPEDKQHGKVAILP